MDEVPSKKRKSLNIIRIREGQINIDYLMSYFVFLMMVLYASSFAVNHIGPAQDTLKEDNLHMDANIFSERLMGIIEINDDLMNQTIINRFRENKTYMREHIDPEEDYRSKIIIEQMPIIITNDHNGTALERGNPMGNAVFNKSKSQESVNFTLLKRAPFMIPYELVNISGESHILEEGNHTEISGINYTIKHIDPDGEFIVLSNNVIEYGWLRSELEAVKINKYSTLDGFATKISIWYH